MRYSFVCSFPYGTMFPLVTVKKVGMICGLYPHEWSSLVLKCAKEGSVANISLAFRINKGNFAAAIPCGNSSVGRARPCQGRGRGFESRFPLTPNRPPTFFIRKSRNGGIGRHEGLKIPWPVMAVRVRVPLAAQATLARREHKKHMERSPEDAMAPLGFALLHLQTSQTWQRHCVG